MTSRPLIDISSWQHPSGAAIDWAAVAASGVVGVIAKVTQGVGYASPWFAADYAGAGKAGLLRGAYHFAQPNVYTAAAEAAWCNEHTAGLELELGLWLDLEVMAIGGGYPTQTWATDWLIAMHVGTRLTGVYMNQSFCAETLPLADTWPLWQVTLEGQEQSHNPVIVQTSAMGEIPGIVGQVDHDELLSSRWVNPAAPPPVAPPAPAPPQPLEDDEMMVFASPDKPTVLAFNGRVVDLSQAELDELAVDDAVIKHVSADLYAKLTAPPAAP